jgi:hypothetical protein
MWRSLNAVARYPADLAQSVCRGWDAFWYTPSDPILLGMLRIMTGLLLLYTHAVWGLALDDFFGEDAWISRDLAEMTQQTQLAFSFWWSIPMPWIWPAYAAAMLALACFTIGFITRVSSALALFVVISFINRQPEALFGLDKLSLVLTLYLTVGPSGAALSVDRFVLTRGRAGTTRTEVRPSVGANFSVRLIQVHMCIIYFFAAISKLQGQAWWNGQAMWLAFGNLEYQALDMTWLAWHPRLIEFLTHFSVLWELSFCVLIWIRILRPLVLSLAVVMHVGIGATLGLWTFSLIMLIGCASFLPSSGLRWLVGGPAPDDTGAADLGAPSLA